VRRSSAWPEELPPITDHEAIELVRRLYRKFMGRSLKVPIRITTGNRLTWHRGDRFDVNPKRVAWRENHHVGGTLSLCSRTMCTSRNGPAINRTLQLMPSSSVRCRARRKIWLA
jgi:hypothetical protein